MIAISSLAFLCFIATIRFFSGEPAWGPRYLTPMFGVLWLFVPLAAARVRRRKAAVLLAASFGIQVLGLTLEPLRFFTGDNAVAADAFLKDPWTYFRFDRSQLLARPRQLCEVLARDGSPPAAFTPAKAPTLPWIVQTDREKHFEARHYQVLSALRPWWITYRRLPPGQRPIDLRVGLEFVVLTGGLGLAALLLSCLSIHWLRRGAMRLNRARRASLRTAAAPAGTILTVP